MIKKAHIPASESHSSAVKQGASHERSHDLPVLTDILYAMIRPANTAMPVHTAWPTMAPNVTPYRF